MKRTKLTTLIKAVMGFCLITSTAAQAQFSSGSTGADGPLNITTDTTLDLPPDGIFNFTTINVAAGATLTFNRNPLNTPVYLLATGDVVVSGVVHVNGQNAVGGIPGKGGPGGFDGGYGAFSSFPPGSGQGPGGGAPGQPGVFGEGITGNTNIYGNTLLSPLIGGSGGGGNSTSGGSGGGGAILVASSTKVTMNLNGGVNAGRGVGGAADGSGGAVRIVAPVVAGTGTIDVAQSHTGRIRIDSIDRFAHRNLKLFGKATRGSQMFVFPPNNPKLDIIHAAGSNIPEGTNAAVVVNLQVGSSTNQIVRVQARGFTNDIPIRVKITPENAPTASFDGVILQTSGNPPFADVQVTLPVDTVCYVHAWTR
jgi:hypothetical protein